MILVLLLIAGCSEPPQKEIDQAQAAVDAARSAGADRYATADFSAAVSSLDKARAAVEQRDYRQALNYALDSRQRAVDAGRLAADGKARARTTVNAAFTEAATRANALQSALRTAEANKTPAKLLKPGQTALRAARADLQKASAEISSGNYEDATKVLTDVRGKLDAAIAQVKNIPPRGARRQTG